MVQFSADALRSATIEVFAALAPALTPEAPPGEALVRYVEVLARFGAHTDLVGARSAEALAEIALADALVLARQPEFVQAPAWEVGAGGASLLIPLALLLPELTGKLIEPRQKRATFLRMAIGTLGLARGLTVEQSRLEPGLAPEGVAGCALARAVFPPDVWIPMASRLVKPGGAFAVLTTEQIEVPAGFQLLARERYVLPHSRAMRVASWLRPVR